MKLKILFFLCIIFLSLTSHTKSQAQVLQVMQADSTLLTYDLGVIDSLQLVIEIGGTIGTFRTVKVDSTIYETASTRIAVPAAADSWVASVPVADLNLIQAWWVIWKRE